MNILSITSNTSIYNKNNNLKFMGASRTISNKNIVGDICFNTTSYFRNDLDYEKLVKVLKEKYKSTDKVTVINHACSVGEETYSLIIKLKQLLGEEAEKFFPIIAKDFDEENIKLAQRGVSEIRKCLRAMISQEYTSIRLETNNQPERYFDILYNRGAKMYISPKEEIKKKAVFFVGDIIQDVKDLPPKVSNTIFICRNMWAYLSGDQRNFLAQELGKKMDESCLVIVGDFDYRAVDINLLLAKEGFHFYNNEPNSMIFSK